MLGTVPAAKPAGSQPDAIAKRAEAATLGTKVKKCAVVQLLHPAAARGARLLKSGLAIGGRHDWHGSHGERTRRDDRNRSRLSCLLCAGKSQMGQPVLLFVSRAVSLKNEAGQGFKACCLGHCLAAISLPPQVSRCLTL